MFHYPSELSHWWGRRGGGSDRVVVERRDWPYFAANHRIGATCRILSQSAGIGRKTSSSAQGKKIDVPKTPRHFLISRGPSCGFREDRVRKTFVPKVLRHALTKYGELSRIDRIKKPDPKMAEANFPVRKSLCHSLICREGVLCSNEPLSQAIENIYRPATPPAFPLYTTAEGTGMVERKRFLSRKASHCL